uniref:Odorant receptor n=1 Tax=Dendroctonus ponderosae TaxID=77166 RepID=A0AAR5NZ60_DENPD
MICCSLLGIFPWQFMFEGQKRYQSAYAMYSKVMLGYYIFFLISAYIKLFILLNTDDELQMDAISANICITFIYSITRQLIMKNSTGFRTLIKHIIDTENSVSTIQDSEIDKIRENAVKESKRKSKWYLYILCVVTLQYILRPAMVDSKMIKVGNMTKIIKPLPLSSWFPFDEQEFYKVAYVWQVLDSLVGASFVTYTDILMFNIIVFPIGQIKKLQHCLKNFEIYKEKHKILYNITDDEKDGEATFIEFVFRHRQIID